jgi:hypothetical protein
MLVAPGRRERIWRHVSKMREGALKSTFRELVESARRANFAFGKNMCKDDLPRSRYHTRSRLNGLKPDEVA